MPLPTRSEMTVEAAPAIEKVFWLPVHLDNMRIDLAPEAIAFDLIVDFTTEIVLQDQPLCLK